MVYFIFRNVTQCVRNSFAKDLTVSKKEEQVMTCLQLEVIDNLQIVHFHK